MARYLSRHAKKATSLNEFLNEALPSTYTIYEQSRCEGIGKDKKKRRREDESKWNRRSGPDSFALLLTQNFVPQNWSIPIVWFSIMTHLRSTDKQVCLSREIEPFAPTHDTYDTTHKLLRPTEISEESDRSFSSYRTENRSLLFSHTSDSLTTLHTLCHTAARNATEARHRKYIQQRRNSPVRGTCYLWAEHSV